MFRLIPAILAVAATIVSLLNPLSSERGMQDSDAPPARDGGAADSSVFDQDPFEISQVDLDEPIRIRFRLADGARVQGELKSWHGDGFDGTFGRRRWLDLHPDDLWPMYVRVMNRESAHHWANLGRLMLLTEGQEKNAERAFRQTLRLDENAAPIVEWARDSAAEAIRREEELKREIEEETLKTESPEARGWQARPWPVLTEYQQQAALREMRDDATDILDKAGISMTLMESQYFLFYSDMPRLEAAKWARQLDAMYGRMAKIFGLEEGANIFWGKAVIFVFQERDRFRVVEAQAFNYLVPRWVDGVSHFNGPKVFVSFHRKQVDREFAAVLVHETAHGFMHRFTSPARLPVWANEGFAEWLAATTFDGSPVDEFRRWQALEFVRNGGNVNEILGWTYEQGWPGPDNLGYAVGYLLVWLMIKDQPYKFGNWVKAIKNGEPWEEALAKEFGTARAQLVDVFVRYFKVND